MKSSNWGRHLATYGLGQVLLNAFSFILLPIYTHRLTPADFGVLEILGRSADVLQMVLACGLFMATLSFYQHESGDPQAQTRVFPTAIRGVCVAGGAAVLLLMQWATSISSTLLGSAAYGWAVRLLLVTTLFEVLFQVGVLFLQARLKSGLFVVLTVTRLLFGIGITIALVTALNWGIRGVLVANLLHTILFAVIGCAYVVRENGFEFDRRLLKEMVALGLPLLPSGVLMFVLNNGDRYVMQSTRGATELGLYALGYKIGRLGVMFVLTPFLKVWGAVMIQHAQKEDGQNRLPEVATYFIVAYTTFSQALAMSADEILHLIAPSAYWSATSVVPLILLSYLFWGLSTIADTAFYVKKNTKSKPFLMAVGAFVSLALYFLLIPRYGMMGGAWATLGGFFVFYVVTTIVAHRTMPIRYEYGRMLVMIILGCVLYAALTWLLPSAWMRLAAGVLSTFVLPLLAYAFIASPGERASARAALRNFAVLSRRPFAVATAASSEIRP
jgi:O-antigen/teichoic acid export membrane protein